MNKQVGMTMKSVIAAAIVIAGTTSATDAAHAQAARESLRPCTARVVYSEELPFAPIDSWLVKVTLQITPQNGAPYITTLQDRRRGADRRFACGVIRPIRAICSLLPAWPSNPHSDRNQSVSLKLASRAQCVRPMTAPFRI
jgi:hypothetical protein